MDIISFSEVLQKRIKEIEASSQDDLVNTGQTLTTIREILIELKQFTVAYTFGNEEEEIKFFKEIKPVLLSQYYYCKKKFEILFFDSFRDKKSRIKNYYKVLQKFQRYASKNQAFYQYCVSGVTYLDTQYFTRNDKSNLAIENHEKFSTGYDTKLAKILAHELIKEYILKAIRKSENNQDRIAANMLQWTTSKVALIELIYALHVSGSINHGKNDVKQIVSCFEELFSTDLGNYSRVFSEIRLRKSGQTNFLDHMKMRVKEFINNLE